jgi:DNA-binding MarR family transcriptional regulator
LSDQDQKMRLVHALRALAVEFGLLGEEFAKRSSLNGTDLRAIIELLDASRSGVTPTPGWLGDRLGLNSASVTALVDRLERMGHVERSRDTGDRRRVRLSLTPAAVDLGWTFFGAIIQRLTEAMDGFTGAELTIAERFLRTMIDVAGKPQDVS